MNINWSKLVVSLLFWLTTEILLGMIGLDDLADYSEFVYQKTFIIMLG